MNSYLINILFKVPAILLSLCSCICLSAQQNSIESKLSSLHTFSSLDTLARLHLRNVVITGNRKTKDYIIVREMHLKQGDSIIIASLNEELEKDRQFIYNTTLFAEVTIKPQIISAYDFDIHITVKERWYIYPMPELELVDQTLDQWLMEYKGDLNRVNYGAKFTHYNLTGRKDQLRLHLLNGYTRTVYFNYRLPYTNLALTEGISVGGGYFQNREIAYKTSYDNKLVYYKKSGFVKNEWDIQLSYILRKKIKTSQYFSLNFTHLNIDDSLINAKYNSSYFNKPTSQTGFVDLLYTIQYIDVNNVLYPLTGITYKFTIVKRGLGLTGGINLLGVQGEYNKYWWLGKKWYASTQLLGMVKVPFKQPYINQQSLGYNNAFIRGLEYLVIDGVAYGVVKTNLKRELFNFSIPFLKKSKTFNRIPFHIYAKTFADMGFSYIKDDFASRLNNKLLYGGGFGIDIVTFYDVQIRIEYSLNQLGQNRLILHNDKGF